MKPMSLIHSPKEERPKLMPICNQGEFFMEPKEIKQSLVLEEVFPTAEVFEELDKSLKKYKRVGHDKLFEILPLLKDN